MFVNMPQFAFITYKILQKQTINAKLHYIYNIALTLQ